MDDLTGAVPGDVIEYEGEVIFDDDSAKRIVMGGGGGGHVAIVFYHNGGKKLVTLEQNLNDVRKVTRQEVDFALLKKGKFRLIRPFEKNKKVNKRKRSD